MDPIANASVEQPAPTPVVTEEKPVTVPVTLLFKEIELPISKEKVVIHKLKVGKYYKAQKFYLEWVNLMQAVLRKASTIIPKELVDKIKTSTDIAEKERLTKEFLENSKGASTLMVDMALDNVAKAKEKRLQILEVSLDIPLAELSEKYFPEDVEALLSGVEELNNFTGNLKNFVAPSAGTGAK